MEMTIQVASHEEAILLFGLGDRNLKILRDAFDVRVTGRGLTLKLRGEREPVEEVAGLLSEMLALFRSGSRVAPDHVEKEVEKRLGSSPRSHGSSPRSHGSSPRSHGSSPRSHGSSPRSNPVAARGGDSARRADAQAGSVELEAGSGGVAPLPRAEPDASRNTGRGSTPRHAKAEELTVPGLARSEGQNEYLRSIQHNDIVFCIGPAGTGKTFLAVYMAVSYLKQGLIRKIILCRPAVEAGEKLGFLPGDFQAKINPYLRPLYDALNDILDYDQVKRYLEREIIEIIPLAYMRGRTLNNAFIILDEGQNTSVSQMKMFLTRMGMSSRIVVNGDITQVDLPEGVPSGLIHAQRIIRSIPGIGWIEMKKADIVRHPLVRRIVEAYEEAEAGSR
jgi:phosphate starvation-inducible protein PhoH